MRGLKFNPCPPAMHTLRKGHWIVALIAAGMILLIHSTVAARVTDLNAVATPNPDPANLSIYVKNVVPGGQPVPNVSPARSTIYPYLMIALGKAFFWDMQVGSDGTVACATCHFKAGIDDRERNTIIPGPDGRMQPGVGKNGDINLANFPFRKMVNPMDRGTGGVIPNDLAVAHDFDDVVGAQGVLEVDFVRVREGRRDDAGRLKRASASSINARNIRQITGRQAPSVINAVFNMVNFWDGRAHNIFNGQDPFGPLSFDARVKVWNGAAIVDFNMLTPENVLTNSSLASQAVGPPLSHVEMSWKGRVWPKLGRKLLALKPLANQSIHPNDSIFGTLGLIEADGTGLNTTYGQLIRQVFSDRFWNAPAAASVSIEGEPFSLLEANFALFWGLAVQAYESILVADNSITDQFDRGNAAALANFSAQLSAATGIANLDAQRGKGIFESGGTACENCHAGAETTAATNAALLVPGEARVEFMPTLNSGPDREPLKFYDIGFYNVGVRRTSDDRGRGGLGPNNIPLAFTRHGAVTLTGFDPTVGGVFDISPLCAVVEAAAVGLPCPSSLPPIDEGTNHDGGEPFGADGNLAVNGAFKTPHLRNIELTGPYFHNGGAATLMQVVEFYTRGSDFREKNQAFIPFDLVDSIGQLQDGGTPNANLLERQHLVAFLLSLTDERVRQEAAPFDHPQFFYAEGHRNELTGHPKTTRWLKDNMVEIKATGRDGRSIEGIAPLRPSFSDQGDTMFHFRPTR